MLADMGKTYADIAEFLFTSKTTIVAYVRGYARSKKLTMDYKGRPPQLTAEQSAEFKEWLVENTVATAQEATKACEVLFGVVYSSRGITVWLHANGFTWKKAKGQPAKADPVEQAKFVAEYEVLKKELGPSDVLLFSDAVHPTQATKLSQGWILKGQDKIIPTTGARNRMNIVGSLNLSTLALVHGEYDKVDSDAMQDHFAQIKAQYATATSIHLILDRGPANFAKDTQEKAKQLGIVLHYLPPYSPNLNPIERLWKVMNEQARNNQYFQTKKAFNEAIRTFLDTTWPSIASSCKTRINDNFETLPP